MWSPFSSSTVGGKKSSKLTWDGVLRQDAELCEVGSDGVTFRDVKCGLSECASDVHGENFLLREGKGTV